MNRHTNEPEAPARIRPKRGWRLLRGCAWGCAGCLLLLVAFVGVVVGLLTKAPPAYRAVPNPIPPPAVVVGQGGLAGFDSPYLRHTGSSDGKGGAIFGASKVADLLGVMSTRRRAAWRVQFMTRAFAAGIRKLAVMDAPAPEQVAVRTYIRALPNPFPMAPAMAEVRVPRGRVIAFKHTDGTLGNAGTVWVAWALAGSGSATVEIDVLRPAVQLVSVDGLSRTIPVVDGRVRVDLEGDAKMAPPVLLVDREPRN